MAESAQRFSGDLFFLMVRETIEASNKTSTILEGFALRRWCWHREDLETLIFMRSCRYVLLAVSASILQRLRPPSVASRATFPLLRRLFGLEKHGQSLCGVTSDKGQGFLGTKGSGRQWGIIPRKCVVLQQPRHIIQFCFPPSTMEKGTFESIGSRIRERGGTFEPFGAL